MNKREGEKKKIGSGLGFALGVSETEKLEEKKERIRPVRFTEF